MELMRWRDRGWPFRELDELREEMDRLFERTFGRTTPLRCPVVRGWAPAVEMFERSNEVVVKTELPGMSKEEIDISVLSNTLVSLVSGSQRKKSRRTITTAASTLTANSGGTSHCLRE
jgi:HSP20 family protein